MSKSVQNKGQNPKEEVMSDVVSREIPKDVNIGALMRLLEYLMPIQVEPRYTINIDEVPMLIVTDMQNGFCTPGCGPLAPPVADPVIVDLIERVDAEANKFIINSGFIAATLDWHDRERPEPPYLLHCEKDSVDAQFVKELGWLNGSADLIIRKGCMNAWVGAETEVNAWVGAETEVDEDFHLNNQLFMFINERGINVAVVVGICTDICVMQLVHALLSARNAGLLPTLRDVVVIAPACATFNLPIEVCRQIGKPDIAAHPREANQHIGLYYMQQAGAILAKEVVFA
ncbi:MAG: isochorismatase family protein [Candidatus Buchananbacteria bacterium]